MTSNQGSCELRVVFCLFWIVIHPPLTSLPLHHPACPSIRGVVLEKAKRWNSCFLVHCPFEHAGYNLTHEPQTDSVLHPVKHSVIAH